jgi:hypothetical protein
VSIEDEQASIISMTDRRRALLTAALGFLELPPRAPELRLLHWWLDRWMGVGLITVGVERLGYRLSLSHIAEGEWRATFQSNPMFAPAGFELRLRRGRRFRMPRGRRSTSQG